jgi:hypothetical protein
MLTNTVCLTRRHVLGDLYGRCDAIEERIPVYMAGEEPDEVGFVDESLGHYADAFTFHLNDGICKKLAAGYFSYSLDYVFSDATCTDRKARVKLNSITLTGRATYAKPLARRHRGS